MATALPSPVAYDHAISALKTAADGSREPYRQFIAAAVALLQFQDSSKRQPSAITTGSGITSRSN
jgi:hypothetical protein